jgi:alkylation response protein AidB-like acyl-CoA dehydrogenase
MASIFASPQGHAVPDGDGWRLSGEWPFASNSLHSEWAIGILKVTDSEGAESRIGFAMMKRGEYTVKDTWFTIGMRGSGSNTMVAEDLWIPKNRIISFEQLMGQGPEKDPNATFGRRLTPHLTMSTTIQAPSLGAAEAALAFVTDLSTKRGITYTSYKRQVDSSAFVQGLGAAAMKIDGAYLQLLRSAQMIDAAASSTEPIALADRAKNRGGIGHAGHELVDAVNDLCWLHGTAAFGERSLLGRMWRDINTGTRHASIAAPMGYELHGNGLTGIDYISPKL